MIKNSTLAERSVILGSSRKRSLLLLLGVLLFFAGSMYFAEIIPRYIDLPISPPDHYEGGLSGNWMSESQSVLILPPTTIPDLRVFILRKKTMISYDEAHNIVSWESIIEYFDRTLGQLGWARSETYAPCQTYLAEAEFLPENTHNGYVYYRRKEYRASYNLEESDVICLAVWGNSPDLFNVVLLTARPSYLTILSHLLL